MCVAVFGMCNENSKKIPQLQFQQNNNTTTQLADCIATGPTYIDRSRRLQTADAKQLAGGGLTDGCCCWLLLLVVDGPTANEKANKMMDGEHPRPTGKR
jgi:hypothetical protein